MHYHFPVYSPQPTAAAIVVAVAVLAVAAVVADAVVAAVVEAAAAAAAVVVAAVAAAGFHFVSLPAIVVSVAAQTSLGFARPLVTDLKSEMADYLAFG